MLWAAFLRVFLVWSFWLYLPNGVIVMAADQAREGSPKESILDPTSLASVAQLLDRDGYRSDSEYNRSSAEFFSSKQPHHLLLRSGQHHTSDSDQRNDSPILGLSLRLTVRVKTFPATRVFPNPPF